MAVTTRTIVGRVLDGSRKPTLSGEYRFTPTQEIRTTDGDIVLKRPTIARFTGGTGPDAGEFSVELVANDSDGLAQAAATWRVELVLDARPDRIQSSWNVVVPKEGSGKNEDGTGDIELGDLVPVTQPGEVAHYLTQTIADDRYARISQIPTIPTDLVHTADLTPLTTAIGRKADGQATADALFLKANRDDLDTLVSALVNRPNSALRAAIQALAPAIPAPVDPPTLTVSSITATSAVANVGPVTNASGYEVDVRIGSGSWTALTGAQGGANPLTGLTANTANYSVRARAVNAAGAGPYATQTFATPPVSLTTAPTLTAASPTFTGATLTLGSVTGTVDGYELQSRVSGGTFATMTGTFTPGTILVTGLSNNTTYEFRARATNSAGPSPWSDVATIRTLLPVTGVDLTAVPGDGKVDLTATSTGATSHKFERGTTASGPWTTIATQAGKTFTDSGRTNTTQYFYRVTASNADTSVTSSVKAATPLGAVVPMTTLVTRNVQMAKASGSPSVARYNEPGRTRLILRNLDSTDTSTGNRSLEVAYSTGSNGSGTVPTTGWVEVPAGSQFTDTSGNINRLFVRTKSGNAVAGTPFFETNTEVTVQ